ncbi:disrupted in renal carcinoma protein 2 homolog isoform X1 [Lingula anatina]|uniref:Disrupted in renal carcinoma protein 2 homolog isoform X1 n=1 Tax=Lingula anatina TaxID=7574 RepID=A0A1S3HXA2_LINAN|nr:disrupted in renal carcinoma protein 2 homolog isoform X1 [Lingula anatina]|eukprot:XP_013390186.1 disrupted in renal carcinoma protein 2 homolog isoform X1 [Lingula anatina]
MTEMEDDARTDKDVLLGASSGDSFFRGGQYGSIQSDGKPQEYETYTRRWYILILFSLFATLQGASWNAFGPIEASSKVAFGWNNAQIALIPMWGNVAFALTAILGSWLMNTKGLRAATVLSVGLATVGAAIRCISVEPVPATWLINIGAVLNGLAAYLPNGGPPFLSAIWFPPHQRTTATAVSTVGSYMGTTVSFIIGPLLVPQPSNVTSTNCSTQSSHNGSCSGNFSLDTVEQASYIRTFMFVEGGIALALFLPVLIYFPSKPPKPPSASASVGREDSRSGYRDIITHGQFWLVCLAYCIPVGAYGGFSTVLALNLKPLGVSEDDSDWIGFWATIAGCISALVFAVVSDIYYGHLKRIVIILSIVSVAATAWFTLTSAGIIPFTKVSLYASAILSGLFINGLVPLLYEMACEATYPIDESIPCTIMTVANTIICSVFLLVFQFPNVGTSWMNWFLLSSTIVSIPLVVAFKENYRRSTYDSMGTSGSTCDTQDTKGAIFEPHSSAHRLPYGDQSTLTTPRATPEIRDSEGAPLY